MRYWYDTEFLDNGRTIDLISIGIVSEDGREYYAHVDGYDKRAATLHPFLSKEVMPYLRDMPKKDRHQVREEIAQFLAPYTNPDLWGYFPAYDHVCLSQLWGTMLDPPRHIPQRTNCIAQLAQSMGVRCLPDNNPNAHDALSDAKWTRCAHLWLDGKKETA